MTQTTGLDRRLSAATAAYTDAVDKEAELRADICRAESFLIDAEFAVKIARSQKVGMEQIARDTEGKPVATAPPADSEARRLKARIEALYDFVATKWPEADDVLDEIRAIIEPENSELEDGP